MTPSEPVIQRLRTRGHEAAKRAVARWIAGDDPPQAIVLSGPPSVGKTTLAVDLAAGSLCLAVDPRARPCWTCLACRKVDRGAHPDVHRLAPQGPGGQVRIAAVRELAAALALLPLEGRRRIAIIESAERLNDEAQNALLKTLEEPPSATVVILCVADDEPILPTVRSRCVRLVMPPLAPDIVAGVLAERGVADPVRATRVARLSGGRPGVALRIAAQPEVEQALGRVARRLLDLAIADRRTRLAAAADLMADGATLEAGDEAGPAAAAGDAPNGDAGGGPVHGPGATPARRRRSVAALLDVWRGLARDLALVARGGRTRVRWIELVDELEIVAHGIEPGAAERFLERVERTSALVEANVYPELALDTLLLAWPRVAAGPASPGRRAAGVPAGIEAGP